MKYKFVSNNEPKICIEKSAPYVVNRSPKVENSMMEAISERAKSAHQEIENKKLCNGHDCLRVLSKALRTKFGSNSEFDSDKKFEKIGRVLRLAYEFEYFRQTLAFCGIREWERKTGYIVLRA